MSDTIQKREEHFHDDWAHSVDPASVKVDELETACTLPETRYIIKRLGKSHLKGRKILEIGCGCGEASVYFAKQGAEVYATDLSPGMVELAQKVAAHHRCKIHGCVCAAEELPFEDNTFDVVYAANVLHHVDIDKALDEVVRVLKKNGVFVAWDPVAYNPAINIYRRLARRVRTEDEHPITRAYLGSVQKRFNTVYSKGSGS